MENIIHEGLENFSGLLRSIYLIAPDEAPTLTIRDNIVSAFSMSTPSGVLTGDAIPLSLFNKIDCTMDTISFKEELVVVSGDDSYKKSVSGVVAKDRQEVFNRLKKWHRKRAMVVLIDRNDNSLVIGTRTEPVVILFNRSNGPTVDDRNQYDLNMTQTSREPAAFCNVTEE